MSQKEKNKDWKKTKTIYWSDAKHDDFNELGIERPSVPSDYEYIRKGIKSFFDNLLYFLVAIPLIGLVMLLKGIKVEGRKNLRSVKKVGAYLYSNHVSFSDVTKFQPLVFPFRRVNILGYSDSLNIPVAKYLVKALGYLPLPLKGDLTNMVKLANAMKYYALNKKQINLIYPEAHIWPYYTKIRDFGYGSFIYPANSFSPVIPAVTIWKKRLIIKKPRQVILIGEPIFPKEEYDNNTNKIYLHDECLKTMKELANKYEQYEYIKYIYEDDGEKKNNII